MVAIIKYKERLRVVFILGQDSGKIYCLTSHKIPENLAAPLSRTLYPIESLGKRIEILKDEFPSIYRSAFRVLDVKSVNIVEAYEQPKSNSRSRLG